MVASEDVVAGFRGCCRTLRLKTTCLSALDLQVVNEMDVEGDYPLPLGEGRVRVSVFA